jgi:cholesterol transport system auxiliary component
MRIRNGIFVLSLILLCTFVTGCGGLSKKYPERTYYMFEVPAVKEKQPTVPGAVINVWKFEISPGSSGNEFIYRMSDVNFKSDFYNQFFRPPSSLLTEATTRYLGDSGLFSDVVTSTSQSDANYYLESNVVKLYGDYRAAPKAVMEIQFFLLQYVFNDTEGDTSKIVFSKTYSAEVPIASASAGELMRGWNTALSDILGSLLADLGANVKPVPVSPPPPAS